MKFMSSGFILALTSMVFMGISNYLYKRSTEALGPTNTTFYYYMFSAVIAVGVWLAFREERALATSSLVWPLLIALSMFLSVWTFNLALQTLDVSVGATVRGLFFVVTAGLAMLFGREQLQTKDLIAVAIAVIAVILFGSSSK